MFSWLDRLRCLSKDNVQKYQNMFFSALLSLSLSNHDQSLGPCQIMTKVLVLVKS